MREYTCREVKIPFSHVNTLRQAGKLEIWMDYASVSSLYKSPEMFVGGKQPINFMIWYFISACVFLFSINSGLLDDGYVALTMLVFCLILYVAGQKSKAEMKSFEASKEKRLYEAMQTFNVWVYKMSEEDAAHYYRK